MLSGRRAQVLELVAEAYIRSVHPVPSAPIADKLKVSSATVRNDFLALEEDGYLQQPHTSAGRTPTTLGYQYYANKFIPPGHLPGEKRQQVLAQLKGRHGDGLFQQIASIAAELSGYAVVVSLPADDHLHALEVHLSALSSSRILAVVILENGLTRQLLVELEPAPSDHVLRDAEYNLRQLTLPLGELPRALHIIARRSDEDLSRTLTALADAWPQISPSRYFSQGLKNLLGEPESTNPGFVRRVLEFVEQPEPLKDTGRELLISLDDTMAHVIAQLQLGQNQGTLVLLGPPRMRYRESLMIAHGITQTVMAHFEDEELN